VGCWYPQTQQNVYIKHCIEIEQYLMEGAYNKVIQARQSIPAEPYAYFMDLLMHTVRCVCLQLAPSLLALLSPHVCGVAHGREWVIVEAADALDLARGCRERALAVRPRV